MKVVIADDTLENLDLERFTGLADRFSDLERNIAFQNGLAIFRHENRMVLNFENRMATVPVVHRSYLHKDLKN